MAQTKNNGIVQTLRNIPLLQGLFGKTEKAENGDKVTLGEQSGTWAVSSSKDLINATHHPLYGISKVDLDSLSLYDFYAMKDYYQIKTSLSIIGFTLMSINWWVDGGTKEINEMVTWQLNLIWGQLMKNITKAYWSGYSPNVKIFDVHPTKKYLYIKSLRDLSPFMCHPSIDPADQTFNGFVQSQGSYTTYDVKAGIIMPTVHSQDAQYIDTKYAFWYPFMMEGGDLRGNKLLKGAYSPWFFSQVMHLYENRYFQRFSTPVAVGEAPSGVSENSQGDAIDNQEIMARLLSEQQNNSSISLPSERDENGNKKWDIKLLEPQMRGFDFEGYHKRLDMEMARAMFLPDLIFNSGRVGSYKLGQVQKDTFLMLLNALMNDFKYYVDNYIIKQIVEYNFSPGQTRKAPLPVLNYEKQGTNSMSVIMELVGILANGGKVDVDVEQIAKMLGAPLVKATPEPAVKPVVQTEPKPTKKDTQTSDVANNAISTLGDILKMNNEKKEVLPEKREVSIKGSLSDIIGLCAMQSARICLSLEQGNKDIKLGYRAKLDKIVKIDGLYDMAVGVISEVLKKYDGQMISVINKSLYESLLNLYVGEISRYNKSLEIEIAGDLDNIIQGK